MRTATAVIRIVIGLMLTFTAAFADPAPPTRAQLDSIRLPPGFSIDLYASGVPGARSMAQGPKGILFVGTRDVGKVYALLDRDGDQRAEKVVTIATGLTMPNGVAFRNSALYVAEISRVLRFDGIVAWLDGVEKPLRPVVLNDTFPKEHDHGWKFIRFGPDGLLYVPVGVPCNICKPDDPRYGSIMRMKPDGTGLEVFARGIRNTVGFDWQPGANILWFTDNGRDMMGDDLPPDELNRAPHQGMDFGFPYCHGGEIADPKYGKEHACSEFTRPAINLGPHVAALGMRFYTGSMLPVEYREKIFIAEHGSWNRSRKIGYRVSVVSIEGNRAVSYVPFAQGWLQNETAWGRPVDVEVMPDGALLVSDDKADAIYRITYKAASSSKQDRAPRAEAQHKP